MTRPPAALALDLGTTSIAALAVSEHGVVLAKSQRANTATVADLPAGHAEQDPLRLRQLAFEALGELRSQADFEPVAIGLTGQMHGVVLVDDRRRPLTNLITWQDRRSASGSLDAYLARCPPAALERSGCRISTGYLAATLDALGDVQAHRAAFLADWIGAELRGGDIVTDRTNAGGSGVYDLERDEWSTELIAAGGFSGELLPPVQASGTPLGGLSDAAAHELRLPPGTPLCNAIGDNQAAVLGSAPDSSETVQINVGTGGQINWKINHFRRVPGMETRSLPHGRFLLVGAGFAGGSAYAWVQRTVASWLRAFGVERDAQSIYSVINDLASRVEHGGLACDPTFEGHRRDPSARGAFRGVSGDNFTPGHVARAVLEGIVERLYDFYREAANDAPKPGFRIVGTGNALRNNRLMAELLARRFGSEVWMPRHAEEAAYGTALLAGSQTGLWKSLEVAGRRVTLERLC